MQGDKNLDIWNILGIEKTKDKGTIKKAYRMKLVAVNPEDDAEGFMELRQAYEEAERYADAPSEELESEEENENRKLNPMEEFHKELEELYNNFYRRISEDEWRKLLDMDVCVALDTSEDVLYDILHFIMDHFFLPGNIFRLLVDTYSIEERRKELCEKFPQDFIEYIISNAAYPDALDFYLFDGEPYAEYDVFIDQYYELERAVRNKEITEQDRLISELTGMDITNPCLDILQIRNLLQKEQYDTAKERVDNLAAKYPDSAKVMICQGDVYSFFDDNRMVRSCYEKVLKKEPEHYIARAKLAELDLSEGEYEKARDAFLDLLKESHYDNVIRAGVVGANEGLIRQNLEKLAEHPEDKKLRMELAWSYYQSYKFQEAVEMLASFSPDEESVCEYYNVKGRSLLCLEDYDEALSCFFIWKDAILAIPEEDTSEEAEKKRVRLPYVTFLIGDCYLKKDDYEEAARYINEAISKEHDESVLALEAKCELEYKAGNYTVCIDSCDRLEQRDRRNYMAADYRTKSYYAMGMYQDAMNASEKTISIYPYLIEPYEIQMKMFMSLKDYDNTKKVIERYMAFGIDSDVCLMYEARIAMQREQDYEKALQILTTILPHVDDTSSDIDEVDAYFLLLGECYEETDRLEEAAEAYERAVQKNDRNPLAHGLLGLQYRRRRRIEEALAEFTRQLELNPSDFYYLNRGLIYKYQGRSEEAKKDFAAAVQINPGNETAFRFLGESLIQERNYQEAMTQFDRGLACSDDKDKIYSIKLDKAKLYKLMQDYKASEALYVELIDDYGMDFRLLMDYSYLLEDQGRLSEAEREVNRLLYHFPDRKRQIYERQLALKYNSGDTDRTIALYERFTRENLLTKKMCFTAGILYLELRQYQKAEKALLKACELDTENESNYYSELAEAAAGQFGSRARVKRYVKVLKERIPVPETPEDLVAYARAARVEKQYQLAREYLMQALKCEMCMGCMQKHCSDAYMELGRLLETVGKKTEALLAYEKALEASGYDYWCLERIKRLKNDSRN